MPVLVLLAGCTLPTGSSRDDWSARHPAPSNSDDSDCRKGRGRVDETKWQNAVDRFQERQFKNRKRFREAKQALTRDLLRVRDDACDWERPFVDRLLSRVKGTRWEGEE